MRTTWIRWVAGALVGIAAAFGGSAACAQSAPVPTPPAPPAPPVASGVAENVIRLAIKAADGEEEANPLPVSDYWIGIALGELPELAKQQLGLKQGVVVSDVLEGSPAAKAEFKTNDILIKAGETALTGAADLIKAVDAAKEKELPIVIIRSGKEQTIKVAPIKRPSTATTGGEKRYTAEAATPDVKAAIEKLREALSQLESTSGSTPLRFMLARPGVVPPAVAAPLTVFKTPEFPKNLSIQINKKGDQPAKIHVEQDGKSWDATEGKLDDLPEDVRVHVQHYLGHRAAIRFSGGTGAGALAGALPGVRYEYRLAPPAAPAAPTAPATPAPPMGAVRARTALAPVPAVPGTPATPGTPVTSRLQAYRIETTGGNVEGKLDAIIKKLDQLETKSVEQLEREVKQLRKEIDELRSRSPGERRERNE